MSITQDATPVGRNGLVIRLAEASIVVAGGWRTGVILTPDGWVQSGSKGLLHNRKVTK
jgi:hypothetical protein